MMGFFYPFLLLNENIIDNKTIATRQHGENGCRRVAVGSPTLLDGCCWANF
jgi:hypothetical protein